MEDAQDRHHGHLHQDWQRVPGEPDGSEVWVARKEHGECLRGARDSIAIVQVQVPQLERYANVQYEPGREDRAVLAREPRPRGRLVPSSGAPWPPIKTTNRSDH